MHKFKIIKKKHLLLLGIMYFCTTSIVVGKNINSLLKQREDNYQTQENNLHQISDTMSFNIFNNNLNSNERKEIKKILFGLQFSQEKVFSHLPLCVLTQKEIATILYFSNKEFQTTINVEGTKNNQTFVTPTNQEYLDACQKISACIQKTPTTVLNFECHNTITAYYLKGLEYYGYQEEINLANQGADTYINNNIEDGPYDILYDIRHIKKILFDTNPTTSDVEFIFYQTPSFEFNAQGINNAQQTELSNRTNNAQQTESLNRTNKKNDNNSGILFGHNTTNTGELGFSQESNQQKTNSNSVGNLIDEDILAFKETINQEISYTNEINTPFIADICNPPQEDTERLQLTESTPTGTPFSDEELDQYLLTLIQQDNRLERLTNSSSSQYSDNSDFHTGGITTSLHSNSQAYDLLTECAKQCETLENRDEKTICTLQCLCTYWSSPAYKSPTQTFNIINEGALRLRACTIPSEVYQVDTGKKTLYSISEFIEEIYKTVKNLAEGGELLTRKRPKEYFSTSLKLNLGDTIAFIIKTEFVNFFNNNKSQKYQESLFDKINKHESDNNNNALEQKLYKQKDLQYWLNVWGFLEESASLLETFLKAIENRTQTVDGLVEKVKNNT